MNQQQRWAVRDRKMEEPAPCAAFSSSGGGGQCVLGAVEKQNWMGHLKKNSNTKQRKWEESNTFTGMFCITKGLRRRCDMFNQQSFGRRLCRNSPRH